jgi:DtxR family Mn-dependent transcriptional regulator
MSIFENEVLYWIITALIILIIAFLPRFGVFPRLKEIRLSAEREALEDALKFLFDQQQMNKSVSEEMLVKTQKHPRQSRKNLRKMKDLDLIDQNQDQLFLTAKGEKLALQIVRAHRLWERYLADEARIPLSEVHQIAHRREHGMTIEQINALDASLGHPLTDPHGDPIPNPKGVFRPFNQGVSLLNWNQKKQFKIIHLEDEPPMAYAQILASGLFLGQTLQLLESNETRIRLSDGIEVFNLAPSVAANIYIQALSEMEIAKKESISLAELQVQQKAEILTLDEQCQGFTRRRFLDLGLTPGTEIFPELNNSFGDPRAYRVRGTLIALRNDQAALIWVLPIANS